MRKSQLIKTLSLTAALSLITVLSTGCESDAQNAGLIGAGIGALAGQAIGNDTTSTLIGTAIGASAGYVIGNESDKNKERQSRRNEW